MVLLMVLVWVALPGTAHSQQISGSAAKPNASGTPVALAKVPLEAESALAALQVYVVNFSAGAITFKLRFWTDLDRDWSQLQSDISIAVNDALIREKIAIA
jgi:small-conductance mechanosensitive channel